MRRAIVVLALGACGGGADRAKPAGDAGAPAPAPARRAPNLPVVDDASLVMAPLSAPQPAAFVWVGTDGKLETAPTGPKWTGEPPTTRTPADLDTLRHTVLESAANGSGPMRDDARAALAVDADPWRPGATLGGLDLERMETYALVPVRDTPSTTPLVLAAPKTPARAIAQVLGRTGGLLAVVHDGEPRIMVLGFGISAGSGWGTRWLEVHPEPAGVTVLVVPGGKPDTVAWKAGAVDRKALHDALAKSGGLDIDVLIGDDTTAQQLVDLLAVAQTVFARRIGIGERVGTIADRARAVLAAPSKVTLGQPNANGDLDKAIIRRYIKRNLVKIQWCYEKRLLVNPGLDGTVQAQFFITPDGNVASATASGVDPEIATCVAEIIKGIQFPKPKGGGGVQVNYPFTFRPTP